MLLSVHVCVSESYSILAPAMHRNTEIVGWDADSA